MTNTEKFEQILNNRPDLIPVVTGCFAEFQIRKDKMLEEDPNTPEEAITGLFKGICTRWFTTDYAERFMKYNREREKLLKYSEDLPAKELKAKLKKLARELNIISD